MWLIHVISITMVGAIVGLRVAMIFLQNWGGGEKSDFFVGAAGARVAGAGRGATAADAPELFGRVRGGLGEEESGRGRDEAADFPGGGHGERAGGLRPCELEEFGRGCAGAAGDRAAGFDRAGSGFDRAREIGGEKKISLDGAVGRGDFLSRGAGAGAAEDDELFDFSAELDRGDRLDGARENLGEALVRADGGIDAAAECRTQRDRARNGTDAALRQDAGL